MPNIISGKYKRTKLAVHKNLVRPTSSLKKEAIFSIIESYAIKYSIEIYKNRSIIDICAGSGSVGLEAISRGMDMSYFIENNIEVSNILKNNCKKICENNQFEIILEDAVNGVGGKFEIKPSIIFIDPPYGQENIEDILNKILKNNIKLNNTFIVIEISKKQKILIPKKLSVYKEKIYGKTKLLFLN